MGEERRRKDGAPTTTPIPARGYKWENFKDGNIAALRHGAYHEATIAATAGQIRQALLERDLAYFAEPHLRAGA